MAAGTRRRIFGFHPVHEALRGGSAVGKVWVLEQRHGARREEIEALCRRAGVAIVVAKEHRWAYGRVLPASRLYTHDTVC